jgi:glycosyltransferase involved in cell wall biosynthesis
MSSDVAFAFVVPVFNGAPWISKCLTSLRRQRHTRFRALVIDDASTDATNARAARAIAGDPRFTLVRRPTWRGGLANIVAGIAELGGEDEEVIALVDGDDWLRTRDALTHVAALYRDPDVWISYGSCYTWKGTWKDRIGRRRRRHKGGYFPPEVLAERDFRRHPWISTHLKAFRRFLWSAVRDEDLRERDGGFYRSASDVAIMLPMLEMAGAEHLRYLEEPVYVYNLTNPLAEGLLRRAEQLRVEAEVRARPKYPLWQR